MNFGSREEEKAMSRYIISLLIRQAKADGDFSIVEKKYLTYAAHCLKLTLKEVAAIRLQPDNYSMTPPPDESKRMTILYYLLFMMKADEVVTAEEEQLSYVIGHQLGFRVDMIEGLISHLKEHLNQELPPDSMILKSKAFLN